MAEREMDDFERRFATRLRAYADVPVAPVDATAVARDVAGPRTGSRVGIRPISRVPAIAWVVLALAAAIAGGLVAGRWLQQVHPLGAHPVVIALEDGLWIDDDAGTVRRLLRDDGSFINPRWSPDGSRIAVIHGPPIPSQTRAVAGTASAAAPFDLVPDELLVLDPTGATTFAVPGPILDVAWARPAEDGSALLAVGRTDGVVTVYDGHGGVVSTYRREASASPGGIEPPLTPRGLAWASPTRLLIRSGSRVVALDAGTTSPPFVVADVGPLLVHGIDVNVAGTTVAFVVAGCETGCSGEVRFARVAAAGSSGASGVVPGASAADAVIEPSTSVTWMADDTRVLAWPYVVSAGGSPPVRLPIPAALSNRDVVAAWARPSSDGSGRLLVLNQYPMWSERHFDAWVIEPDATAIRVGKRSLGFDIAAERSR